MPEAKTTIPQVEVRVVITVPFVPVFDDAILTRKRGELAIKTFSRALDLAVSVVPNAKIIVVLEKKIENQVATQGIRDVTKQYEILLCDEFETIGRWYRGIRRAFDENCEKTLVLPGDIEKVANEEKFRSGLRSMVSSTEINCLTVGDYTSTDPFKEKFDPCFSHLLLNKLFPAIWPKIEQVGIKKVRSEYFCIGYTAFQAFQKQGWRWLPLDATMLLMLAMVTESSCKLKRVDLGQVSDLPTRKASTAIQQILRFGVQVWFNGHSTAGETVEAQTSLLTDEWWPIIVKAMEDLLPLLET